MTEADVQGSETEKRARNGRDKNGNQEREIEKKLAGWRERDGGEGTTRATHLETREKKKAPSFLRRRIIDEMCKQLEARAGREVPSDIIQFIFSSVYKGLREDQLAFLYRVRK